MMEEERGCCGLPSWAFFTTEAASRTVSASAALHLKPFVSVARVCHGSACFPGFHPVQASTATTWIDRRRLLPSQSLFPLLSLGAGRQALAASQEAWPHFPAFSSRTARCCKLCSSGSLLTRRKHSLRCIRSSASQGGLERGVVFHVRQQA